MKFGIDIGHNCPPDIGASGIQFEDTLTLDVGTRVISKLRALGHEVIDCKPQEVNSVRESLSKRCSLANSTSVDIYASIHFNAFNSRANGTEVYAISEAGRKIAKTVLDEIVKLGFVNRGVKSGTHLFVLRNTDMVAVLIEGCFIDSPRDMTLFEPEAMANAIVKGLTGELPKDPINLELDEEQNADTTIIRLQRALNRLKITDQIGKPLIEDNRIGEEAVSAIKKFQKIVALQITGIAGETTWSIINLILAKRIIRANHAGGPVVRYLQYRIGADIDGIYGPQSASKMKIFQQQNGLLADGIVGPQTWKSLID